MNLLKRQGFRVTLSTSPEEAVLKVFKTAKMVCQAERVEA
jgi:hypothetical protein